MKLLLLVTNAVFLGEGMMLNAIAEPLQTELERSPTAIPLNQYRQSLPSTRAQLLQTPSSLEGSLTQAQPAIPTPSEDDTEEEVVVEGQKKPVGSSPVYTITGEEIDKQGAFSVNEVLKNLPGFAINDTGFGADIHTGFYYRGTTLNQNIFLLNGRSINSNINTYHGATDLNTLLTGGIDRVELSSGTAATLYGSEAFGGVVNIITKDPTSGSPKFNVLAQAGSYGRQNYRGGVSGGVGNLGYAFAYERFQAENDYPVPKGAANRGDDGRLFNGDTRFDNYYGRLSYKIDPRNTISLDTYKITSRKGLMYFGFPLQRDRLNHDALNMGLSWRALVGGGDDSIVTATLGFNRDYFDTFGPTQNIFFRQGTLDARGLTARVEHNWQVAPIYNLRYGIDLKNEQFEGETLSNLSQRIRFNEVENRDRTNTALFILNTFKILDNVQFELGLRQNFNSEYGSSLDPSAGIRWELSPEIAIRSSFVSVRRIPGLDQLYLYDTVHGWQPNPNLKPEIGSAWTVGMDVNLSRAVSAQFTYFGNSLSDRLGIVAGQWQNINLVNTNGFEAAVRWQITPQFSALANYTYTDARIESGAEKGLQLSTVPFSVGQLGFGYDHSGWQVNLYASYNSGSRRALFTDAGVSSTDFSPSWLNLDLNARIPIVKNVAFLLYLENLANVSYEKVNRIYQPGLTFRVGVSASF
ncbi:TonB-dependent receptor plug domain-containing protein [Leptolyngbyaceae cyanobacterium UHCC 1019]